MAKDKSFYKCGHDRRTVFLSDNILSYVAYEEWRETNGFDGDKTQCWTCWNKKEKTERK